jgi:hypothetical protein
MVWMDVDGDEILFNTAEGRRKLQDLRRDPRVTMSVQDLRTPQSYAVLYGTARTITEEGARTSTHSRNDSSASTPIPVLPKRSG